MFSFHSMTLQKKDATLLYLAERCLIQKHFQMKHSEETVGNSNERKETKNHLFFYSSQLTKFKENRCAFSTLNSRKFCDWNLLTKLTQFEKTRSIGKLTISQENLKIRFHFRKQKSITFFVAFILSLFDS